MKAFMNRAFARAALALLVVAPLTMRPAAAGAVEIKTVDSASGVSAWLVEDYSVPIVTVAMSFEGGSSQDPQGKEGLANLLTTLFDEGAGPLDSAAFQAKEEQLGVTLEFSDGRDAMSGVLRTLRDDRAEAFEMLRLSLNELRFEQAAIDRMRGQLQSRIQRRAADPNTQAGDALRDSLFGEHPYGRRSQGTVESLAAITRDDIVGQFRKLFARSNLKVSVVGAISAEETAAMLDQVFGGLPQQAELTPVPEAELKFGDRIEIDSPAPQTTVMLALPGVKRSDPDFFAAFLVTQVLGGGTFSSRLYEEVREKRGLAYSVGADLSSFDHAAYLSASSGTRSDRAAETLSIIRSEIARMAAEGPTQEELDRVKRYVIGSYAINFLDTSVKIARALVTMQTEGLGIDYIDRREELIDAVTLEQAKAVAARLLGQEPTTVVVGPRNS